MATKHKLAHRLARLGSACSPTTTYLSTSKPRVRKAKQYRTLRLTCAVQATTFYSATCPACGFPELIAIERQWSSTRQCPACGAWHSAHAVRVLSGSDVQPALIRNWALVEGRLRETRGRLDTARHEGQRLRDEVEAGGARERRLEETVEEARQQVGALQQELGAARHEVEELRGRWEHQVSRERVVLWQLGAAMAEVHELREEAERLREEADRLREEARTGGACRWPHPRSGGGPRR